MVNYIQYKVDNLLKVQNEKESSAHFNLFYLMIKIGMIKVIFPLGLAW